MTSMEDYIHTEPINDEVLQHASACLKVMAHPVRLKIADILLREQLTVSELAVKVGLPHHQVCEHLRHMQSCGLLDSERAGKSVYYRVISNNIPGLLECIRKNCETGK